MYCYTAYGLNVWSALALPELGEPVASPAPDVVVRAGAVDRTPPGSAQGDAGAWACPDRACFHFDGVGTFHVAGGREVTIDAEGGADERVRRLILLGPVLAVLLHQRGLLVLHASAVALGRGEGGTGPRAVAFVGDKGAGKSTTAAALHARGHALVSDDVVAVDLSGPVPLVRPGFPHLKLWPEAAASTLDRPEAVDARPRVHPDLEKRSRTASRGFPRSAMPLAAVYALEFGDRDAIEPAGGQESFAHLVRHSYLAQLLRATGAEARHFRQSVQLARAVPVRRLLRRRDLGGLSDLARRIEQDAGGAEAAASPAGSRKVVGIGC